MQGAIVAFIIAAYLYYRPAARAGEISKLAMPGKYPGHVDDILERGHQWFEDPLFFLREQ